MNARHKNLTLSLFPTLAAAALLLAVCAVFGMRYNPSPPYELVESAAIPAHEMDRIKNFARFWELIVNRGLADIGAAPVFDRFMALSDSLLARFGRNWGLAKNDLLEAIHALHTA